MCAKLVFLNSINTRQTAKTAFQCLHLVQVTFVCLIYPALVLCYAGQAAFISKKFGTSDDIFHISESVPSSMSLSFYFTSTSSSLRASELFYPGNSYTLTGATH